MAEQQPQNKVIVEETKVPPADEVEEEPVPKGGSPVPPVAKASTPELTESPEMVAAMAVELTTTIRRRRRLWWRRSREFPALWRM